MGTGTSRSTRTPWARPSAAAATRRTPARQRERAERDRLRMALSPWGASPLPPAQAHDLASGAEGSAAPPEGYGGPTRGGKEQLGRWSPAGSRSTPQPPAALPDHHPGYGGPCRLLPRRYFVPVSARAGFFASGWAASRAR